MNKKKVLITAFAAVLLIAAAAVALIKTGVFVPKKKVYIPEGSTINVRDEFTAQLTESVSANHGRAQVNACRLEQTEKGLVAQPVRSKSGLITQLAGADGYFIIDRDCEGLPQGAQIHVFLN